MAKKQTKLAGLAATLALVGAVCGYVAEAHAIDRAPFPGRPIGDGGPGYGAERQYYGAENIYRPYRGYLVRHGADHRPQGWRSYEAHGSFVDFGGHFPPPYGPDGYARYSRAGVYPGFGGTSVVYLGSPADGGQPPVSTGGAKIIDVDSSRLDRSGEPKTGISVTYVGSAKIIRIASTSGTADPARASSSEAKRAGLEPWSDGWERYCTRTHPDFDPTRGTFTDRDGRSRFCTGE